MRIFQDVSIAHDFLAQESQEVQAHDTRSSTRESTKKETNYLIIPYTSLSGIK
jgi:hypothetical protein